jgi:lipid A ethanolaminephosphotransferase
MQAMRKSASSAAGFSGFDDVETPRGWNPLTLAALASAWLASACNWPLWRAMSALPELNSARGVLFMLAFGGIIFCATVWLLSLAAWARSIKVVIAVFLISAALCAHFMGSYGVVIDPTMMLNVVQTDVRETGDLVGWPMLVSVLLLAVLPMIFLWRLSVRRVNLGAQLGRNLLVMVLSSVVIAGLVIASFADLSSTMRNHKTLRYLINPLNAYFGLAVNAVQANAKPKGPPQAIGLNAKVVRHANAKPPLLLLVVGETARADHFSLNGYARPTNVELAALGVTSFRDVTSCGTNTAASLPCMFSHLGKSAFESRERDHENLLDVLQRAGLAVLWLDNQSGCKGLCERVPNAYASAPASPSRPLPAGLCASGECLDAALLHDLETRLLALPEARRQQGVVIVLHHMGSHGPAYFKRSPPERKPFMPECTNSALQKCNPAALINAYDNSIAYTDHVLAASIAWLKTNASGFDAQMLYVSDHGESLGENNLYLHGLPYAVAPRAQKHVPMIFWQAPTDSAIAIPAACLNGLRDTAFTHDNLFHTVLGLAGVTALEYRKPLDAFAACRTQ